MTGFFNPESPKYRRGVFVSSVYLCTIVAWSMLTSDWGTQDHVFTPIQAYINKKGDKFFNVTQEELTGKTIAQVAEPKKPLFRMHRVDIKKDEN